MVLLTTTPRIIAAIDSIPPSDRDDLDIDLDLPKSATPEGSPISHDRVIRIARYFRERRDGRIDADAGIGNGDGDGDEGGGSASSSPSPSPAPSTPTPKYFTLNDLLRGTKIYVPPPPPKPEPSPEYLAQKAKLLAALQTDTYNNLLSPPKPGLGLSPSPSPAPIFTTSTPTLSSTNTSSSTKDPTNPNDQDQNQDQDPLTPSLVLNIFLSILITGFSVYWALSTFSTPNFFAKNGVRISASDSESVRVLVALFSAIGVGVAEVGIYVLYLRKLGEARVKEGRVRERKVVVGEVGGGAGVDGGDAEGVGLVEDKEEIWGRGVNGGVRRRVKERWEEKERGRNGDGSKTSSSSVVG